MTREPPEDYEVGEEFLLMEDGALELAERTLKNAVDRLEYVETLIPEPEDGEVESDWSPLGRAQSVHHDAGELLREVRTERRSRQNVSLDEYDD